MSEGSQAPARGGSARRTGAALGLLLATMSLAAGCGSGGGSAPKSQKTPLTRPSASAESFAAYRQCLSDHGVAMPTGRPTPGAPRPSLAPEAATEFRDARKACASLRPTGGLTAGGIHNGPRRQFRECLRRNGVVLPAPPRGSVPTGAGASPEPTTGRGGMLAGLDLNDPTVHKAIEACRSIIIENGSTPGPGGGTPGPAASDG